MLWDEEIRYSERGLVISCHVSLCWSGNTELSGDNRKEVKASSVMTCGWSDVDIGCFEDAGAVILLLFDGRVPVEEYLLKIVRSSDLDRRDFGNSN